MGQRLASKIDQDFQRHVRASPSWARLEEGVGLTATEATELYATMAGGLLAGLKTLALALDDPELHEPA